MLSSFGVTVVVCLIKKSVGDWRFDGLSGGHLLPPEDTYSLSQDYTTLTSGKVGPLNCSLAEELTHVEYSRVSWSAEWLPITLPLQKHS